MAVITNQLVTVLRLVGQQQYAQGLLQAAAAAQALAVNQAQVAAAQRQMAGAQQVSLASTLLGAAFAFGVLEQAIRGASEAGIEFERAMVRASVIFRNRQIGMSGAQAGALATQLSLQSGTSATELLNTEAYLGRFHIGASQIPRDMQIIIDASKLTGRSVQDMAHAIEMAHMGSSKALRDLGIPIHQLSGYLTDMQSIFEAVNREVRGMSAALNQTVPGQFDRMVNNWNLLLLALEKVGSGSLFVLFKSIADILELAVKHAQALYRIMEGMAVLALTIRYGWAGFFAGLGIVGFLEIANRHFGNKAAGAAAGMGNRTDDYLRRIEFNTGPEGPLGRAVRAGGSFGEPGGGLRIRDYNQMARHIA